MGEEWARIKREGTVEAYWRWLRHVRAGGAPGGRNAVSSLVAKLLGLTTVMPPLLDGEFLPYDPVVAFRTARKGMPDIDSDFL